MKPSVLNEIFHVICRSKSSKTLIPGQNPPTLAADHQGGQSLNKKEALAGERFYQTRRRRILSLVWFRSMRSKNKKVVGQWRWRVAAKVSWSIQRRQK